MKISEYPHIFYVIGNDFCKGILYTYRRDNEKLLTGYKGKDKEISFGR